MVDFPTDIEIGLTFPDNNSGDISAADMRTFQTTVSVAGDSKLSPDQVLAGVGINVTDNGDGTITLTNTGGGGGGGGVPLAGEGITITDNGDDTYTVAVDPAEVLRPADVSGTMEQIVVTDGGDGTITISIDPAYGPVATLDKGDTFPVAPVDGEMFYTTSEKIIGTYRWDEADGQWHLTQPWQNYSQSVAMLGKAKAGENFTAGSIVALNEIATPDPLDPVFSLWTPLTVEAIRPDASYDLPGTIEGGVSDSSPSYSRKVLNVPGMGIAARFDLIDLSGEYGTVNWQIETITVEGNNNTTQNSNMKWEIWSDNAGEPGAVLVAHTDIDHTSLAAVDSQNTNVLILDTPLNMPQGSTFWAVCLYNNRDQAVEPGDSKPGGLSGFPVDDNPGDWFQRNAYLTTPIDASSAKYTVSDGGTWVDDPQGIIARLRVKLARTSSLEPPTNVYAMCLSDIDENTHGGLITYGPLTGDMSGASVGETWVQNDTLYWNPLTFGVTNQKPADSKDEIIVGTVFNNDPVIGTALVTLMMSGTRGILMSQSIYDPNGWRTDAFNLNNMTGKTDAYQVRYDNSDSGLAATDVQQGVDELAGQLGGYTVEVVDTLPGSPDANTIYFVTT